MRISSANLTKSVRIWLLLLEKSLTENFIFCAVLERITLLQRYNITKPMNKGGIAIATFADFSKSFGTIYYAVLVQKLDSMNFSKFFLYWLVDCLSQRQQYGQIDDIKALW